MLINTVSLRTIIELIDYIATTMNAMLLMLLLLLLVVMMMMMMQGQRPSLSNRAVPQPPPLKDAVDIMEPEYVLPADEVSINHPRFM